LDKISPTIIPLSGKSSGRGSLRKAGARFGLTDLILLRAAFEQSLINRWKGAEYLQTTEEEAAEALALLRARGYLEPVGRGKGTGYRLPAAMGKALGEVGPIAGLALEEESLRRRVLDALAASGRLSNAEIRSLLGIPRLKAARLMQRLRDEGQVELAGQGRGARWIAGTPPRK
jgi:biotin operon repressor